MREQDATQSAGFKAAVERTRPAREAAETLEIHESEAVADSSGVQQLRPSRESAD